MNPSRIRFETSPVERGTLYRAMAGDTPWSCREALDALAGDAAFRRELTATLAASPCVAFRWETPPITLARVDRPFEFVLVDSPHLAPTPEPEAFAAHFASAPPDVDVLAVPNLGHTATLVVPRQLAAPRSYAHLARFVREAPEAQVHHLWQCVASHVKVRLSERALWLSTAGGGVSWLHVRIEGVPKYYAYRPYARDTS